MIYFLLLSNLVTLTIQIFILENLFEISNTFLDHLLVKVDNRKTYRRRHKHLVTLRDDEGFTESDEQ